MHLKFCTVLELSHTTTSNDTAVSTV